MQLDFFTLYVVILLNSTSFAVVWALVALGYRSMIAARYWLAALVMTCASGPLLFLGEAGGLTTFAGLALVSGSFATMWQGLRVFYGHRFSVAAVSAAIVGTLVALLIFGPGQEAVNLVAAISQIIPVALAAATLRTARRGSVGAHVVLAAACIVLLGQGGEALANAARLMGVLSTAVYYDFAAWFLVCAIVGASMWNLGFLLITNDRLQSKLLDLATRDDLTGLMNRRGFRETMLLCETSTRRKNRTAVLMMVDLDKFKSVNDMYGHAAGDAALIHIADQARAILRDNDVMARVGGDEFCILLPNTGKADAARIAQRLGHAIATAPFRWKGRDIPLSASIGMTEWRPGGAMSLLESLERADELMFGAKNGHAAAPLTGSRPLAI